MNDLQSQQPACRLKQAGNIHGCGQPIRKEPAAIVLDYYSARRLAVTILAAVLHDLPGVDFKKPTIKQKNHRRNAAERELLARRRVGDKLANCAFNLEQGTQHLDANTCRVLKHVRKEWDAISYYAK